MLIQSSAKSIHLFYYYRGDRSFCMYSIHCIYIEYTVNRIASECRAFKSILPILEQGTSEGST